MIWSDKYRPRNIFDMVGNEQERLKVVNWLQNWDKGTKPLMLIGPAGVGKTTLIDILAQKLEYDVISLNASDLRNKQQITDILNPILNNLSLFGKAIIFIDEVDGIHGRHDYGGIDALIKILKTPLIPIILAANSVIADKMQNIKKATKQIYFHSIPPRLLLLYSLDILQHEQTTLPYDKIKHIVINSNGDARFMINSLQTAVTGSNPIQKKSFIDQNIEESINNFFATSSVDQARQILYSFQLDPYMKINAFYSSVISNVIHTNMLNKILQCLSEADILYKQILKTQSWHLLRYLNEILLDMYIPSSHITYTKYNLPWQLINKIRFKGNKIKRLSLVLAKKFHVSSTTFRMFYLPYLLFYLNNTKLHDIDENLQEELHELA